MKNWYWQKIVGVLLAAFSIALLYFGAIRPWLNEPLTVEKLTREEFRHRGKVVRVKGKISQVLVPANGAGTMHVYLGAGNAITCLCDPKDEPDFADASGRDETVIVEGFVAEQNSKGQITLRRCKRIFPDILDRLFR